MGIRQLGHVTGGVYMEAKGRVGSAGGGSLGSQKRRALKERGTKLKGQRGPGGLFGVLAGLKRSQEELEVQREGAFRVPGEVVLVIPGRSLWSSGPRGASRL